MYVFFTHLTIHYLFCFGSTYLVAVFAKNSNVECFVICRHGCHLYLMIKIVPQLNSDLKCHQKAIKIFNNKCNYQKDSMNHYFTGDTQINLLVSYPAWTAGKWDKRSSQSEGDLQSKFCAPGGHTPEYDRGSSRYECPLDKPGSWLSTHSLHTAVECTSV
jgi:hypothetical protein